MAHRILVLATSLVLLCGTPALARVDESQGGAATSKSVERHHYRIGGKDVALSEKEAEREQRCLSLVAFAEARGEGRDGMAAIMFVVMNRVHATVAGTFPGPAVAKGKEVLPCDIVAQKGAFEALRGARFHRALLSIRHGQAPLLRQHPDPTEKDSLELAQSLAHGIMTGELTDDVTAGATHFYCPAEQRELRRSKPEWADRMVATAQIGKQVFYR
ncbi:MAG TPA: cell wall hydrolase [Stellaceae bacterium]|nr:cell wall hydrolase [Stellaceae bacterium]